MSLKDEIDRVTEADFAPYALIFYGGLDACKEVLLHMLMLDYAPTDAYVRNCLRSLAQDESSEWAAS
jgi:hypothetical protein